jgi:putative Mn2+ efflux pump MntP
MTADIITAIVIAFGVVDFATFVALFGADFGAMISSYWKLWRNFLHAVILHEYREDRTK